MRDTIRNPRKAHGQCWIVSNRVAIRDRTGLVHVQGVNYTRRSHWANWERSTDTVTDHTMRQFDRHCPAPWVGTVDEWIDTVVDYLNDDLDVWCYPEVTTDGPGGDVETITITRDVEPGPMPLTPGLSDAI